MDSLLQSGITRESIAACIDGLIRKYRDLPDTHRESMSEQDVRDYFVTPLLEALGWGTVDPRERAAEKHLPRHGFSDYELCLPIGPDENDPYLPLIYVEAKKFDGLAPLPPDLFGYATRSEADIQAIDYADQFNPKRGEKIGWAIVTNFEILRVWDSRRNVLVESVDWFTDLKRDRTLEVLFLLSRDQVAQDPALRNLGAYRVLPDIDEKFLAKLNEWRAALAFAVWNEETNFPKLGSSLSEQQRNLRGVVQRTLDRLIVIRTAEDRGLLPAQYRLQEMVKNYGGRDAVPLMLLENIQRNTFSYFDHRYNSKLFGRHLADEMQVHNGPLSRIIDEMCKASFAAMNADILGATYEQYLGQTIQIDAASNTPRLVVNEETRHEQGSYYTPRPIVQAIVDKTLGRYLWGTGTGLSDQKNGVNGGRKRITDIQTLTVLDPACGSGSFLIYAFDVLLEFYLAERARLLRNINARVEAIVATGIPRLAAESQHDPELLSLRAELELTSFAHARIIERHLYGVDLDPQAAEIASMNLLLKALRRDQRLPRILGDNIKVGNSLISGADIGGDLPAYSDQLHRLVEIREEIHSQTLLASENGTDRQVHENRIDALEQNFGTIAGDLNDQANCVLRKDGATGWFDDPAMPRPFNWQVEFPELFRPDRTAPGFTFVIGNPPYVGFHGFAEQKPFLRDTYCTASGKFDLYVPFVERGIRLTSRGGELSYICPSTFMKRSFGRKLRRFILDATTIESVHDFVHTQVFRNVLNYTCICVLRHSEAPAGHFLTYSEGELSAPQRAYEQAELTESPWVFRFGSDAALVKRIKAAPEMLPLNTSALTSGVSEGIVTGTNRVLLIPERTVRDRQFELKFLRKCLRGEEIKRYSVRWGGFYVFYPYEIVDDKMKVVEESVLQNECPNLYAYLTENHATLAGREYLQGTTKHWYELWCPRVMRDQAADKVVVPELADRSQFARVGGEFFYTDSACGFSTKTGVDPWFLIAILNSRAGEFLYRKTTVPKANGFLIYKTMFLNPFPVPDPKHIDPDLVSRVSQLAQFIQAANTSRHAVESAFAEIVDASLPVMSGPAQNFYHDYYSVPAYWTHKRIFPDALRLTNSVSAIRVDNLLNQTESEILESDTLVLSYQDGPDAPWSPLVELQPMNDHLKLFLLLAIRKFLSDNARKKRWKLAGRGASNRTVDVVLQSLVTPTWDLRFSANGGIDSVLQKITDIVTELRFQFSGKDVNPCVIESKTADAEQEIDNIVFDLYGFTAEERQLASIPTIAATTVGR